MADLTREPFVRTFLRPKQWSLWLRLGFFLALVLGLLAGNYAISMYPDIWVWPNRFVLFLLLTWYYVDLTTTRQKIYRLLNDTEDVIKLEVRFFRLVLLVVTAILAIVHEFKLSFQSDYFLPVLIGIIATFGWMYTNFRNEISNRANNTLDIISLQYGAEENALRVQFRLFTDTTESGSVVSKDKFSMNISDFSDKQIPETLSTTTFSQLASRMLNELNRVALGVRQGRYDLDMIEKLLRPRYVRYAYILSEFIREKTHAIKDEKSGQHFATTRTWEHFLWLLTRLPVYKSDNVPKNVRNEYFVHPPTNSMSE